MKIKILVGLGNAEKQYENTYHNLGFAMLDTIVDEFNAEWGFDKKKNCFMTNFLFNDCKIICAKPKTFMNLSGIETQKLLSFYKITKENLFIFVDDIDLSCGKVKAVVNGGTAGHNGIKSVENHIGKGYVKVRLGCGRPHELQDTADYVLSRIPSEKKPILHEMQSQALKHLPVLLFDSPENFNAKVNQR